MSYGVGSCILPIVRRTIAGTVLLGGSYIAYDLWVRPMAKSVMLKLAGPVGRIVCSSMSLQQDTPAKRGK